MSTPASGSDSTRHAALTWYERGQRVASLRLGIIPVPVFVLTLACLSFFIATDQLPTEINVMAALLIVGGFACAELGRRVPVFNRIGGAAVAATFIPSYLAFHHLIPTNVVTAVTEFTRSTNFLYLFITCVIVGSIFGMDRTVLIKGFLKIFVPLIAGSIAAAAVGTLTGSLLGLGAKHTLFYLVVPIMAGGVGEGAIPLSVAYADVMGNGQGEQFAQLLPPVMLGSLTAILLSGALNYLGKQRPHLTGEGRLQPGEHDDMNPVATEIEPHTDVSDIAAAAITALMLYLLGISCYRLTGLPAPVAMLLLAVLVKLARVIPPSLQQGSYVVYRFFAVGVTYPLLFAIGVAMTPWDKLVAVLALPNFITIVVTVFTLMGTGFVVGRRMNLYPIEAAIVNACHSGQGGTGDVAILTAANRMQMMPFAQIATRIGGAITVTLALIAFAKMY
jgi:malate:Na+ symporter